MKIVFYGARPAGLIDLLAAVAKGHEIVAVIPVKKFPDDPVRLAAEELNLPLYRPESLNSEESLAHLKGLAPDLLLCCHGRDILKKEILSLPRKGCINVHPCLYRFKGAEPIKHFLESEETKASVGVHVMTEEVDAGKTLVEEFKEIENKREKRQVEVYNELYPLYFKTVSIALEKIEKELG